MSENPIFVTVNQFCERNPAFTVGGIRWLIFNEETNGFNNVTRRIGRKVLIDEAAFFQWVIENNPGGKRYEKN